MPHRIHGTEWRFREQDGSERIACYSIPRGRRHSDGRWVSGLQLEGKRTIPSIIFHYLRPIHLQVGDRVGALLVKNCCGNCSDCKKGLKNFCEHMDLCGCTANGAAAEYMVADSNWTIPLPSNVSFEAAAPLMCAGMQLSPLRLI